MGRVEMGGCEVSQASYVRSSRARGGVRRVHVRGDRTPSEEGSAAALAVAGRALRLMVAVAFSLA